jgi:hypothetical protein
MALVSLVRYKFAWPPYRYFDAEALKCIHTARLALTDTDTVSVAMPRFSSFDNCVEIAVSDVMSLLEHSKNRIRWR